MKVALADKPATPFRVPPGIKLIRVAGSTGMRAGANDLGGTLMEETISRMAGSENGSLKTIAELEAMAAAIGRPARQRTTEYGTPSAARITTARSDDGRAVQRFEWARANSCHRVVDRLLDWLPA